MCYAQRPALPSQQTASPVVRVCNRTRKVEAAEAFGVRCRQIAKMRKTGRAQLVKRGPFQDYAHSEDGLQAAELFKIAGPITVAASPSSHVTTH